ncbi:cellulase family glycosylhydrolase [Pontibacter sp. 13R65]|uniref:cellulase family glycosylhydrolase n=1 Tax=Pontibacter sp. 13R65 TaxID=3127458 RepID=UPI00301CB26B
MKKKAVCLCLLLCTFLPGLGSAQSSQNANFKAGSEVSFKGEGIATNGELQNHILEDVTNQIPRKDTAFADTAYNIGKLTANTTTIEEEPVVSLLPFGINLAGAEFGTSMPGVYNTNYTYPTATDLDYFKSKGLLLVRLPFKWERIQHNLGGNLDVAELTRMKNFVTAAKERRMLVLLDMHNYARRKIGEEHVIIGTTPAVTIGHVAEAWKRIADEFKSFDNIWGYGIMNEPYAMPAANSWFNIAQGIITEIRTVDTNTTIVVGGDGFSSARLWPSVSDNLKNLVDPSKNMVFEAHVYFDANSSGEYSQNYTAENAKPTTGIERVTPFVNWLKSNNLRGFVGEYGIPDNDPRWLVVLEYMLSYLKDNCINGTYWAAGPWWGDYMLAVAPRNGIDRPQMAVLEKYKAANTNCGNVTSLPGSNLDYKFLAYPNPATDQYFIELGAFYPLVKVTVYDVHGRALLTEEFKSVDKLELALTQLRPGLYFIYVDTGAKQTSLKVIKD